MRKREAGDLGPFYRCYPEGRIHEWDGDLEHVAVPREYSDFASSEGGTSFNPVPQSLASAIQFVNPGPWMICVI